jgi:ABC-type anion transport system duplicated permease subunit
MSKNTNKGKKKRKLTKAEKKLTRKIKNLVKDIAKLDRKRVKLLEEKTRLRRKLIQRRQELVQTTRAAKLEEQLHAKEDKLILGLIAHSPLPPTVDFIVSSVSPELSEDDVKATVKRLLKAKRIKKDDDGYVIKPKKMKKQYEDGAPTEELPASEEAA